jgi:membrane protease YdiL (CAAX protease family)
MSSVLFLLAVYGSTWILCLTLREAAGEGSLRAVLGFFFGSVWTPTIVAILLALLLEGRRSCLDLLRRLFRVPQNRRWLAVAVVIPALIIMFAVLIARVLGHVGPWIATSSIPSMIGLQLVTGATGEELGWRGFLIPRLASRFGFTNAAIVSGLLWSGWHLAGAFMPGTPLQVVPLVPFLLVAALFGIFLAFVFERTGGHVLAPMLAHLSLNVTLGIGGTSPAAQPFWWTLALGTAVVVGAMSFRRPTSKSAPA